MHATDEKRPGLALTVLAIALGALCVWALFDTGAQYEGFEIPQYGVHFVATEELAFYALYALWGSLATGFLAWAFVRASIAATVLQAFRRAAGRPWLAALAAALLVCVLALVFRATFLLDQPITDDESTYVFEAQTLLHGRVVNPRPAHAAFWANQFIVMNDHGWFGKYPLGHPMLLALGEALGARFVIVPLLGLCTVLATFAIGRKLFGSVRALVGVGLLLVSPQFVWTHGTQLSQTSSALAMLLGVWCMLELAEDGRSRWACLAGIGLGFAVLVRVLPGVLFVMAGGVAYLAEQARHSGLRRALVHFAAAAPGLTAAAGLLLLVNYLQTGSPFDTGYSAFHKDLGVLAAPEGRMSNSLAGALVRQNFWLFGWTLSFAFVPFARPTRGPILFWGMIIADYAYRLIAPKTVVSATGPLYVFECVPLLALATADGAARAAGLLARLFGPRARTWVAAGMLSASAVALVTFVPVQLRAVYTSSSLRHRVYAMLEDRGIERALVFANTLVEPSLVRTWAYYPPNPSPDRDDDILFARRPSGAGGPRVAYEFWRMKYPDRPAFLYVDSSEGMLVSQLEAGKPPPPQVSLSEYLSARGAPSAEAH